jgi:AcrR family transcriptional regulator
MPTADDPQPRKRLPAARRRELLLAAASEIVAEVGARRARLADIAHRAGVTKALVYRHFPSKEAMLVALIEDHGRGLISEFTDRQIGATQTRLRDGTRAVLGYAHDNPAAWRILFVERFDDPLVSAAQAAVLEAAAAMLAGHVEHDLGLTPGDELAQILARMTRSAIDALIAWWYAHPAADIDELTDIGTTFVAAATAPWAGRSL